MPIDYDNMSKYSYALWWCRTSRHHYGLPHFLHRRIRHFRRRINAFITLAMGELDISDLPYDRLEPHRDFLASWSDGMLTFIDNSLQILS